MTLGAIARVVWGNDVSLGLRLARRNEVAKAHIDVDEKSGRVKLKDEQGFSDLVNKAQEAHRAK